jgi:hypothetical protein
MTERREEVDKALEAQGEDFMLAIKRLTYKALLLVDDGKLASDDWQVCLTNKCTMKRMFALAYVSEIEVDGVEDFVHRCAEMFSSEA